MKTAINVGSRPKDQSKAWIVHFQQSRKDIQGFASFGHFNAITIENNSIDKNLSDYFNVLT